MGVRHRFNIGPDDNDYGDNCAIHRYDALHTLLRTKDAQVE